MSPYACVCGQAELAAQNKVFDEIEAKENDLREKCDDMDQKIDELDDEGGC